MVACDDQVAGEALEHAASRVWRLVCEPTLAGEETHELVEGVDAGLTGGQQLRIRERLKRRLGILLECCGYVLGVDCP